MKALLITIGDEILLGNIVNTNAAFISQELSKIGVHLSETVVIGDDPEAILATLDRGLRHYDAVISTGGLGPTVDDITKQQIARYFKTELILHEPTLTAIRERFQGRGIPMSKTNIGQAMVPRMGEIIPNPNGTAPGLIMTKGDHLYFALPGVPKEMNWLLLNDVIPRLKTRSKGRIIRYRMLLTTGIVESTLGEKLEVITGQARDYSLAFLPSLLGTRLRITVNAQSEEVADRIIAEADREISAVLGSLIFGRDDETIAAIIGKILIARQETLAVAESCTGGLIANWITDIPGSSAYFLNGVVAYSNAAKRQNLMVLPNTLAKYGAVSDEVAREMANGIRLQTGSTYGLSTTGIAGPSGATETKPVGLVYIGFSSEAITISHKINFLGDRLEIKTRTAQAALNRLRMQLLKSEKK